MGALSGQVSAELHNRSKLPTTLIAGSVDSHCVCITAHPSTTSIYCIIVQRS
jgi:hypothetical protein